MNELDRANHKLAGRCEHCGVEAGNIHTDLCAIALLDRISALEFYVQRLKSKSYDYDNLARKFEEIAQLIRNIRLDSY
jgi:hypothetical protein